MLFEGTSLYKIYIESFPQTSVNASMCQLDNLIESSKSKIEIRANASKSFTQHRGVSPLFFFEHFKHLKFIEVRVYKVQAYEIT
jgi:hypothetical protein